MPAYLVVTAEFADPAPMVAYQAALSQAGLHEAHGERTLVRGRAATAVEDRDGRAVVISEFPDRAAAEAFWMSNVYQREIKWLPAGAGTFLVAIFGGRATA